MHKLWDLETLGIRDNEDVHQRALDDITIDGQRYSVAGFIRSGKSGRKVSNLR